MLYSPEENEDTGRIRWLKKKPNPEAPILIILDEASMVGDRDDISNDAAEGTAALSDLLRYFAGCHPGSRLSLVGDPCQLPPVGYDVHECAPALNIGYLEQKKGLVLLHAELKEVVRQSTDSYILTGATALRDHILYGKPCFQVSPRYLQNITAALRRYVHRYDQYDESTVAMIAWTNRSVNWWNTAVRQRLHLDEKTLMPNTRVLIDQRYQAKNETLHKGRIAYVGDIAGEPEEFAGLFFLPIMLQTFDDGVVTEHECLTLIDHLISERGQLTKEQERHLRREIFRTNNKVRKVSDLHLDAHHTALRLRYGYALTCHKAQGSEYQDVIIHPYTPAGEPRWLYTAVTRAKEELFSF